MIFIQDFLLDNYTTMMIIVSLLLVMYLNRHVKIPESKAYPVMVPALFLYTTSAFFNEWSTYITNGGNTKVRLTLAMHVRLRTIASVTSYLVLPLIMLLQILVSIPDYRRRHLLAIPYVFHAILYATAPFTGDLVFYISDQNDFCRGTLGYTAYIINGFYLTVLLIVSVTMLVKGEHTRGILILFVFISVAGTIYLEYRNFIPGKLSEIAALSVLLYYYYLVNVYQGKMKDELTEKRILMLQEQIRPHFIFNSLGIIRSLVKRDKERAVECIDDFSDYLRFHVESLKSSQMIPFDKELQHAEAYLSLALSDTRRATDIRYELEVTDFMIPPLTLEPLVENSIKHGLPDTGGVLYIKTGRRNGDIILTVSDNGSGGQSQTAKELEHLGVGLENIRKRLEYMCGGTMQITAGNDGYNVEICIPGSYSTEEGQTIENTGG